MATTVAPQIGGNFAGKLVRKKSLSAKLTGRKPGQLEIFILNQTGGRKLTKRVTFTKANQRIKVSLLTKGLKLGRYVLVEQFTDENGVAGPVQARPLQGRQEVARGNPGCGPRCPHSGYPPRGIGPAAGGGRCIQ